MCFINLAGSAASCIIIKERQINSFGKVKKKKEINPKRNYKDKKQIIGLTSTLIKCKYCVRCCLYAAPISQWGSSAGTISQWGSMGFDLNLSIFEEQGLRTQPICIRALYWIDTPPPFTSWAKVIFTEEIAGLYTSYKLLFTITQTQHKRSNVGI